MDAKVLPIPPLSKPKLLGQPYHGQVTGNTLRLPNGTDMVLSNPGNYMGDCLLFQVPGVPDVDLTPVEVAKEAAAGREWRKYALLSGRGHNYGGYQVGHTAWLYADETGAVWRISCDQLDTDFLSVSMPADDSPPPTHFPSTADLTWRIQRFGVIDPDQPTAEIRTIHMTGVSLGGEFRCDPLFWPWIHVAFYDYMRSYPHEGSARQWMPIAIEDVNSRGSKALLCVNRTGEQGAWSLPAGRGLPKSWIEVSVSGTSLDSISLSLSVVRVNGHVVQDVDVSETVVSVEATRPAAANFICDQDYVYSPPGGGPSLSDSYAPTFVDVRVGAVNHTTYHGLYAGAYYDSHDVVQWVWAGDVLQVATCTGSGSLSTTVDYRTVAHPLMTFSDHTEQAFDLLGTSNYSWGATLSFYETVNNQVSMGGHLLNFSMVYDLSVTGGGQTHNTFDMAGGQSIETFDPVAYHCSVTGGVFGTYDWVGSADSPLSFGAYFDLGSAAAARVAGAVTQSLGWWYEGVLYGCPMLREWDGLCVVRVTNKVYAVIAVGNVRGHSSHAAPLFPTGQRVVAIGTPDGWTTGDDLKLHSYASYHPVTRQLAHDRQTVGWV